MGAAAQQIAIVDGVRTTAGSSAWWGLTQRVAAAAGTIALSPLFIATGAAIACLSRRSPLVAHRRAGANGCAFWMLKFRTMWGGDTSSAERAGRGGLVSYLEGAEHASAAPKNGHDPRVSSRLAAFLRRHSLDEMPQLLHVIAGRMSLVGPRPLLESELAEHYGRDTAEVLTVLPGMTGLWQVKGRSRVTFEEMVRMDLQYARSWSLWTDIVILLQTPRALFKGAY